MNRKREKKGIDSRYARKRVLGDFLPWTGHEVTDTLSSRDYLLF